MLSDEPHTTASVRNADDRTALEEASMHTVNSDRTPLHLATKPPRWTGSSPRPSMPDMALTSSASVPDSSSTFTNICKGEIIIRIYTFFYTEHNLTQNAHVEGAPSENGCFLSQFYAYNLFYYLSSARGTEVLYSFFAHPCYFIHECGEGAMHIFKSLTVFSYIYDIIYIL